MRYTKKKAKCIKTRSKCNWYKHGDKSTVFSVKLDKHRTIQSQIHFVIINHDEITLFSCKLQIQTKEIETYLENIHLPKLTNEQTLGCEGITSEDGVFRSLKSMNNNKSPGNDGLSKEFYE